MNRTYLCARCNGTNVSQQIHGMIPLNKYWGDQYWDLTANLRFDWDDFYYCEDCQDGVVITIAFHRSKNVEEPNDGN